MPREGFPSERLDQFMLRMPDGLRDRIKKVASKNYRSMNAEIIMQLERLYASENEKGAEPTKA